MATANRILLFFLYIFSFYSCNDKSRDATTVDVLNSGVTVVNNDADSSFYKIDAGVTNKKYYEDTKGNNLFLITKTIVALDKDFGVPSSKNVKEALDYYENNKYKFDTKNISFLFSINILHRNGGYETVWKWENNIYPNKDGFSVFDLNLSMDASYSEIMGKSQSVVHLYFKTRDYNNGYKQYTLNYTNENGLWKLLSREKINTVLTDNDEVGYCVDTVNHYCQKAGEVFELTLDNITRLDDRVCY